MSARFYKGFSSFYSTQKNSFSNLKNIVKTTLTNSVDGSFYSIYPYCLAKKGFLAYFRLKFLLPKSSRHKLTFVPKRFSKLLSTSFLSSPYRSTLYPRTLFICSLSFPLLSFFGLQEEEEEDHVVHMIKLAILASQRGEDAKAEQLLHVALKAAQENGDQNAVTYIFDVMANFALQKEDFKKAEALFVDVLKRLLQSGKTDDDNAVVEISLKLASIYSNLGDVEKACEGFQFCIGTQEAKLKAQGEENVDEDTLVLWAMSHDWFARFLLSTGHYDRAKAHFSRAYDVCVKVKGPEDPQTAVLLNDLGSVCTLQQNYKEAIEFLTKAIHVGKCSESEDLPSFYVNLGTVYLQKKLFEEAEQYCKEGKKRAKIGKNEDAYQESLLCLDMLKELKKS